VQIVIGVSDAKVSADEGDSLITYSLGSCIGVSVYDAAAGIGGMLHFQLPSSTSDPQRAAENPLIYADTGMAWLIKKLEQMGANKRRLRVRIAGAAQMLGDHRLFDIGRRNHAAIRKIFWQLGLFIDAEHVGGKLPRTMQMSIADGAVTIRCDQEVISL
jgi:chemotaxis protein CheD